MRSLRDWEKYWYNPRRYPTATIAQSVEQTFRKRQVKSSNLFGGSLPPYPPPSCGQGRNCFYTKLPGSSEEPGSLFFHEGESHYTRLTITCLVIR